MPEREEKELNILILDPQPPEALVTNLKEKGFKTISADKPKKILIHLPDFILKEMKL